MCSGIGTHRARPSLSSASARSPFNPAEARHTTGLWYFPRPGGDRKFRRGCPCYRGNPTDTVIQEVPVGTSWVPIQLHMSARAHEERLEGDKPVKQPWATIALLAIVV